MIVHFFFSPVLLLASSIELQLCEQEVILDALTARVGHYLGSALLPVRLGLLEADLVRPVFVVIFPLLFHRSGGI